MKAWAHATAYRHMQGGQMKVWAYTAAWAHATAYRQMQGGQMKAWHKLEIFWASFFDTIYMISSSSSSKGVQE